MFIEKLLSIYWFWLLDFVIWLIPGSSWAIGVNGASVKKGSSASLWNKATAPDSMSDEMPVYLVLSRGAGIFHFLPLPVEEGGDFLEWFSSCP